ncbi:hypothetical protein [Streptomyces sp. XC 2026]|uniref:hypothetical protein n=1 Tax=Streptomyces sp. XC 2026 TaxID=2782004 RepID=UPI0019081B99|nr:hypothetical protein [Streptomyces sp. XC 2026]QQN79734.1 hypothetical protein IPZ77_21650 [Streptomyces sp. XC 2026]QQN80658.1 hypothetical protein IPZ77_27005 [Streptomyces sp. XC 2026]
MSHATVPPAEPTTDLPPGVADLTARLRARGIEPAAQTVVQTTPAGVPDLSVGTVRQPVVEHRPSRGAAFVGGSLRVAATTGIGAASLARRIWDYEQAGEFGRAIRQARDLERAGGDVAELEALVVQLRAERRQVQHARHREPATILGAAATTGYAGALVGIASAWSVALVVPALLPLWLLMYVAGRREIADRERPVVIPGEVVEQAAEVVEQAAADPLGQEAITDALRIAGVIGKEETVEMVGMPMPTGDGAVEVTFELPGDTEVKDVQAKAGKIAKAWKVPVTWMDLREGRHPGECRMWLSPKDPFGDVRTSPLLSKPERQDAVNRGILIGHNRRGEDVHLRLFHTLAILGGASRAGKGMLLRNLLVGLGLDPRVRLRLVAGAKPGEHRGYGPVCSSFFGRNPQRLIVLLEVLLEEALRREEHLEDEGKAKLSEADLDEWPLEVLVIDEFKQYTGIPETPRIFELLERLAAFVLALNITILISTQDPDANTVPRGYKNNTNARVATRTESSQQTNAILADGATGAGLRAHDIERSAKGVAIADLDGVAGELIRSFFIEDEHYDGAAPLIAAGVELRSAAGTLPGEFHDPIEAALLERTGLSSVAGGPKGTGRPGVPADAPATVLELMLAAVPGGRDRTRAADVRAHLAIVDPQKWGRQEGETEAAWETRVGKALVAESGMTVKDGIRMPDGSKSKGYYRADIEAAIEARNVTK